MTTEELLQCYNRGCGQKFIPENNNDDSCRHHPGEPFFHDAYKGWSCCNKKCTDFTEFLNIRGCTVSKHSNIKPLEPEKPVCNIQDVEIIEIKPIKQKMIRPPYDTPMTVMKPEITASAKRNFDLEPISNIKNHSSEIEIGTTCKNSGCTVTYDGPALSGVCTYHPGVPIFHEGLKFWSCCQKRTTDFNTFLSQIGCITGDHLWKKSDEDDSKVVKCRWDFHQTGTHVFISIYSKFYCPLTSIIKLNPIRLYVNLVFPQESGATFNLDIELNGIIDVEKSQVSMFGTKVEIKMKKAEPHSWLKLETTVKSSDSKTSSNANDLAVKVEGVDLDDL